VDAFTAKDPDKVGYQEIVPALFVAGVDLTAIDMLENVSGAGIIIVEGGQTKTNILRKLKELGAVMLVGDA